MDVGKEIEAIKTILETLQSLDNQARDSVLDYVLKRLELAPRLKEQRDPLLQKKGASQEPGAVIHIKQLKNEKKPQSAIEMAALVAYYLSHVVLADQRKQVIDANDLSTFFKIADYPLQAKFADTLSNAKKAGYFDSVERGQYKLNPVGYNLVTHSMPRSDEKKPSHKKRRRIIKKLSTKKVKVLNSEKVKIKKK